MPSPVLGLTPGRSDQRWQHETQGFRAPARAALRDGQFVATRACRRGRCSLQALGEHAPEHAHIGVDVVVDARSRPSRWTDSCVAMADPDPEVGPDRGRAVDAPGLSQHCGCWNRCSIRSACPRAGPRSPRGHPNCVAPSPAMDRTRRIAGAADDGRAHRTSLTTPRRLIGACILTSNKECVCRSF